MITIPRIALFIDVENVTDPEAVGNVVRSLDSVGNLTARFAYGKSVPPKGWNNEFLRRHAIDYVPVTSISKSKKNDIVDKQLIVGAMDHLARGATDVLALVSGDADYGALVRHARGMVFGGLGIRVRGELGRRTFGAVSRNFSTWTTSAPGRA